MSDSSDMLLILGLGGLAAAVLWARNHPVAQPAPAPSVPVAAAPPQIVIVPVAGGAGLPGTNPASLPTMSAPVVLTGPSQPGASMTPVSWGLPALAPIIPPSPTITTPVSGGLPALAPIIPPSPTITTPERERLFARIIADKNAWVQTADPAAQNRAHQDAMAARERLRQLGIPIPPQLSNDPYSQ